MGVLPHKLARELRDRLGLVRAIETGTYKGESARMLAWIFDDVVTIELDPALHRRAVDRLAEITAVRAIRGARATGLRHW
jgi:predicted O-methyltransferase YrrM